MSVVTIQSQSTEKMYGSHGYVAAQTTCSSACTWKIL